MATRNTAAASRLDCSIGIALALTLVSTACSGSSPKRHTHLEPVTGDQDAGHTAGMQDASDGAADAIDASFGFPDFGIDAGALQSGPRARPTKVPAGWACRPDFALDRVCDCGCGALDAYCDPRGCSDSTCSVPSCDACFGAGGERVPCGAPGAWLCALDRQHDGVCDCGCGAPDPDCAQGTGCYAWGCNVKGCERCVNVEGAWGKCAKPAAWTCSDAARSDGKCDCGCGNLDPDCDAGSCTERGCRAPGCEVCRNDADTIVSCAPPEAWSCKAALRGDGVCDCGCGESDPDCHDKGCSGASCDAAACKRCYDEFGRDIACATHYACEPASFADGTYCDCGCGQDDPDCHAKGCAAVSCKAAACDVRHGTGGKPLPPSTWTCTAGSYGSGDGCDCGCGALDPDCHAGGGGCADASCQASECDRCHGAGGVLGSCRFECGAAHFATADGCDCGCGENDPDCGGQGCSEHGCFAAACQRCFDGATATSCERSACDAQVFGDGVCDCGCREQDPDCAGLTSCVQPGCSTSDCARCHDDGGNPATCGDWFCTLEKQGGGDGCNCGCGASDADCAGAGCGDPGCVAAACVTCRGADMAPMSCMP